MVVKTYAIGYEFMKKSKMILRCSLIIFYPLDEKQKRLSFLTAFLLVIKSLD